MTDAPPKVLVIEDIRTFTFPATYCRTIYAAWLPLFTEPWDEVWWDYDMGLKSDSDNTYLLAVNVEQRAHEGILLPIKRMVVHTANPYGGDRLMAALSPWYDTVRVVASDYLAPDSAHTEDVVPSAAGGDGGWGAGSRRSGD